ncbi:MAG TPA: DUF1549 domain-containing protein, partial [Gemmataceae bacterium]|nr:DUF1549 domain-containing protein [Gemmataceae bacterium]
MVVCTRNPGRLQKAPACYGALLTVALIVTAAPSRAASPANPDDNSGLAGKPVALMVQPEAITLTGPRAVQQVVVSGRYADGSVRDLTLFCELAAEAPDVVAVGADGFLVPKKDGATALVVRAGGQTARVLLVVKDYARPRPVSFRHELIGALNVGGCNAGACHGTPSGKNGFRLSLRGYDPGADYLQLTRDVLGRRTDRLHPEASLILQKALARVPHQGGKRFLPQSLPAQVMRGWITEGLHDDPPTLPALQGIDVLPGSRVLNAPARWQQLAVRARFADGSASDVTRLTVFSSSDAAVAKVSPAGLVEFQQSGEAAILCRYLDQLLSVRLTYLEPRKGFRWSNPPENNYVDKHVFAKLKMLSILPSDVCSDQEFLRRAYMDVCGVLPTVAEAKAFLTGKDKDKRARLVDALLERPEYADFWTLKWADVLRSSRKTIQPKGAHVYQEWLRAHIDKNTPLDRVVRELITASGSTFANPPANYYRI